MVWFLRQMRKMADGLMMWVKSTRPNEDRSDLSVMEDGGSSRQVATPDLARCLRQLTEDVEGSSAQQVLGDV